MSQLSFAVPTLFGLEGLAAQELKRLGLREVRGETGRVVCRGEPEDIPRMNLNLRTGERVLLELGRFPAKDFDSLFQGVSALPWEDYIPRTGRFPVKGHALSSQLHAVPACQAIVKKAAATRLGRVYGLSSLPETGELYQIQFSILKDEAALYLDTTGPGLYKRGYRAQGVEAPLRETLAAALVELSRYRGKGAFRDPFCGSGTIVIEAALAAKNRAPGLNRRFSAEKWPALEKSAWERAIREAKDKEYRGQYDILGSDIDPQAVALAQHNARLAGVEDVTRFEVGDAARFAPGGETGRIVTNPPYGERLLEVREAHRLYREFGRAYGALPRGWELYLLSGCDGFEDAFGRRADKRRKLYNGMLRCELYQYLSAK